MKKTHLEVEFYAVILLFGHSEDVSVIQHWMACLVFNGVTRNVSAAYFSPPTLQLLPSNVYTNQVLCVESLHKQCPVNITKQQAKIAGNLIENGNINFISIQKENAM